MQKQQAYELAYYAQYPDQENYLDAIMVVQKNWGQGKSREIYFYLHSMFGGDKQDMLNRQEGLKDMLIKNRGLLPWEKGFVIHALGDAFAHTDKNGAGYDYPYGHK